MTTRGQWSSRVDVVGQRSGRILDTAKRVNASGDFNDCLQKKAGSFS